MCNASLQRGTLPTTQRSAIVAPRLKKTGSDPADVRNYRPISNLTFMSKVVECLVCRQLVAYLEQNGLLPDLVYIQALSVDWDWRSQGHRQPPHSSKSRQSYTSQCARSIHCFWHCWSWHPYWQTISCFWFSWWCTVMDYQLRHWSYTKVRVGSQYSKCFAVQYGVLQGSVLGPILFLLHTADVLVIAARHGISGRLHFLTFAEPKLRSKYLLKSKSEVISLAKTWRITLIV